MSHEHGQIHDAQQAREHLFSMIKQFNTAMLVTRDRDDRLHGRPMVIAEIDDTGDLWFVTGMHTGKVIDIAGDAKIAVTMQSPTAYLSLSGEARLVRDHARIQKLWQESWRAWFPEGLDDGELVLVRVIPTQGEYWDQHGLRGLRSLLSAARSYVTGEPRDEEDGRAHAEARL